MHPSALGRNGPFEVLKASLMDSWGFIERSPNFDGCEGPKWRATSHDSKEALAVMLWVRYGDPGLGWTCAADGVWLADDVQQKACQVCCFDPLGHEVPLPSLLRFGHQLAPESAVAGVDAWNYWIDGKRLNGSVTRHRRSGPDWSGHGPVPGTGRRRSWRVVGTRRKSVGASVRLASRADMEALGLMDELNWDDRFLPRGKMGCELRSWAKSVASVAVRDCEWEGDRRSESGRGWKSQHVGAQWLKRGLIARFDRELGRAPEVTWAFEAENDGDN